MKFSAAFVAFVAGAISFVNAQSDAGVFFTHPVLGSTLAASTAQNITWTVTNNAAKDISALELRKGDAKNLELVQTINDQPIPVTQGFYQWTVPHNLTTDTSYALIAKNQEGGATYSAYFTILGTPAGADASAAGSSSAPATAAASSSAAPTASASSA